MRAACKDPEVITLRDDSDEEESQDLFESPLERSTSVHELDSDDLFSSPEPTKHAVVPPLRDGSFTSPNAKVKRGSAPSELNGKTICSPQLAISPKRSMTSQPFRRGKNLKSRKSNSWTRLQLNRISEKLEKRNKIMTDLVQNDGKFLHIVREGALEQVQKEARERLVDGDVIRKKTDRERMKGVACALSKDYFDALELSPVAKERRINEVSRIRAVSEGMPSTPENYWEIGFPTESEQRRRGLIKEVRKKSSRNLFNEEAHTW